VETVDPETVATEVLDELKLPPLKPEGAEAAEVLPPITVVGDRLTLPAGQEPATTL
jgi:hypothetical protein